jgi:hypothetical protein
MLGQSVAAQFVPPSLMPRPTLPPTGTANINE